MNSPGAVSRALSALHYRPWLLYITLALYAVAVTLPHAGVQWGANEIAIRIGLLTLYRIFAGIMAGVTVLLAAILYRTTRRHPEPRGFFGLWLLTAALIAGSWVGLTANNLELVHYPQYFVEGILLFTLTLSPADTLAWVAILGGLDESYQYWVLPRTRVSLLDFNDIYMDLLGGAAGMLLAMTFLSCCWRPDVSRWKSGFRRPGAMVLVGIVGLGLILWASGLVAVVSDKTHPQRYWFALGDFRAPSAWTDVVENGPFHYHTFTPGEGVLAILATIALFGRLSEKAIDRARAGRKFEISGQ